MQYCLWDNRAEDLIVFFAGWGCDDNQFVNLHDRKNVLILYDYQDLRLDFDFSAYKNIDVLAYSAGVFVAAVLSDKIPGVKRKVALCGNPYLFDEKLGLSAATVAALKAITLDNYLEFRRKYMVYSEDEYEKYNELQSLRTIESCQSELESLQKMYQQSADTIRPKFDKAIIAENDLLFNPAAQKEFYQEKLRIIPHARHHVFFKFTSFADILDY